MIKIQNQEDFNNCLMWVSDLYKDVYGFRPRGYDWNAFSFQELEDFVNGLSKQAEEEAAYIRACEEKSIKDVMSVGAPDEETARRWLNQADAYFMCGDKDTSYHGALDLW